MTGEISLRGLVLPWAASRKRSPAPRTGIKRVLLPRGTESDLDEVPEDTRKSLEFVWLEDVDGAIAAAFEGASQMQALPEPVS